MSDTRNWSTPHHRIDRWHDDMGCRLTGGADPLAVLGLAEDGSGAVPA